MAQKSALTPRQIRLGIIGTGLAAKRLHWPALEKMPDRFSIVAYANRSRPPAEEYASLVGLQAKDYYSDYHDLLLRDDVEAVVVGLPINAQYAVVHDALAAGKHVICEKPAGGDERMARQFLALASQYPGLKTLIAENYYYRDDLRLARSILDAGVIGEPKTIFMRWVSRMVPEPGEWMSTAWRQTPEHRGGIILDAGVHHIAEIRLFGGDFARVLARTAEINPTVAGTTSMTMAFDLVNGITGSYVGDCVGIPLAESGERCLICGTEGSLSVGDASVILRKPDGSCDRYTLSGMDAGYYNEFRNFYDAIVFDAPVVSDIAQNVSNVVAVMKALDAADAGGWVEVPADSRSGLIPLWQPYGVNGLFESLPVHLNTVATST